MSDRTRLTRLKERGVDDRGELLDFLAEQFVAHLAVDAGGYPVALPVAYALDREGDQLYVHGSVGAGWLRISPGAPVCVTVTAVERVGHRQRHRVVAGVDGHVPDDLPTQEGQQLLALGAAALAQPGDPGARGRRQGRRVGHGSFLASKSAYAAARSRSILRPSR